MSADARARETADAAAERVLDGSVWEAFCDQLKAAGATVLSDTAPDDAFDRAEGFRYLTRLLRAGLESFVEGGDPEAPQLRCTAHETIKMGADNPDNLYLSAPIRGDCAYRLRGARGSVHYLGFGTQAGNYGTTGSLETTGYLEARDVPVDAEGRIDVVVSSEPRAGAWLPMKPESRTLIVRQTFLDRAREKPADLRIDRIDGPHRAKPLTPARLDRGLQATAGFVAGCAQLFHGWATGFREQTNALPLFDPAVALRAGGDPNITYYHGYWELAPDEALVIEVTPPACDHWNFQLNNHWMESLDYRYHTIHVNKHSAALEADGSVRVVVAHEDPGVPNWIETVGHRRGTMCWRWIRPESKPRPMVRVVKRASLCS